PPAAARRDPFARCCTGSGRTQSNDRVDRQVLHRDRSPRRQPRADRQAEGREQVMKRLCCALILLLFVATATAAEVSLPTAAGLPVRVHTAVIFAEIESFSENSAAFKATVDVRLRWPDLTLRRPAAEATDPPRVFRGAEAQAQLEKIWV